MTRKGHLKVGVLLLETQIAFNILLSETNNVPKHINWKHMVSVVCSDVGEVRV